MKLGCIAFNGVMTNWFCNQYRGDWQMPVDKAPNPKIRVFRLAEGIFFEPNTQQGPSGIPAAAEEVYIFPLPQSLDPAWNKKLDDEVTDWEKIGEAPEWIIVMINLRLNYPDVQVEMISVTPTTFTVTLALAAWTEEMVNKIKGFLEMEFKI